MALITCKSVCMRKGWHGQLADVRVVALHKSLREVFATHDTMIHVTVIQH